MTRLDRNRALIRLLSCVAILGGAAAYSADDIVTEPEQCLLLGAPHRLAYFPDEHLAAMANTGGVYAFDIASGKQLWSRHLVSSHGRRGTFFGKRHILVWADQEIFLLDPKTGREVWSKNDYHYGVIESAQFSPDETQVLVTCERACMLYTIAGRMTIVLPRPNLARPVGWLDGNGKLLFAQEATVAGKSVQKWLIVDAASGEMVPGWERDATPKFPVLSLSRQGCFSEAIAEGGDNGATTLRISDAQTGKMLREFKNLPVQAKHFPWLADARRLYFVTEDRRQVCVMDSETGGILFSLSREGHHFYRDTSYEDSSGVEWIVSQDDDNNRYLWPLAPEGVPLKALGGSHLAPGRFHLFLSDRCCAIANTKLEDQVWVSSIYSVEDMKTIAKWRCLLPECHWTQPMIDKSAAHLIQYYPANDIQQDWMRDLLFSVYTQNDANPMHKGEGRPLAISPNGHYLAVQTGAVECCVYDLERDTAVKKIQIAVPENYRDFYAYMNAVFSDNGKRLAVNTSRSLEVMELSEGYPHWPMNTGEDPWIGSSSLAFSPDGARILLGGYNSARLYDASSGDPLRTFKETERFAETYNSGGNGFWNGLARSAKDWMGAVTDRFKSYCLVEAAFAENGAKVVTHSAGQILRLWDAESGELVYAIHTGLPEKRNQDGRICNRIILSATARFAFSYNENNFGVASLWSLADGVAQRHYQLDATEYIWPQAIPADDGKAVFIKNGDDLYRWPGMPEPEKPE